MAVYNTGSSPHRQHFYGLAADAKPTTAYAGDKFYEYDTGLHFVWNSVAWVEYFIPKTTV